MWQSTTVARVGGTALAVGAVVWAATMLVAPPQDGVTQTLELLGGFAFQIGVVGFLAVVVSTKGAGSSRSARVVLSGEAVLMALAMLWTIVFAIDQRTLEYLVMVVLDVTWPLSMVGLIPVGWCIWRARVWPRPTRQLPLVASLWLPLGLVVGGLGGRQANLAFHAAWLAIVWAAVGVLVSLTAAAATTEKATNNPVQDSTESSVDAT